MNSQYHLPFVDCRQTMSGVPDDPTFGMTKFTCHPDSEESFIS